MSQIEYNNQITSVQIQKTAHTSIHPALYAGINILFICLEGWTLSMNGFLYLSAILNLPSTIRCPELVEG